jgi:hypothetical protein
MIQPVELSDALSKAEVAGKMNQIQKAHSEMEQRQVAAALKEKNNIDAEKTHELDKSDLVIIEKDKQNQEEKNKDKKKEDESGKESADENQPQPPEHLDVKA